MSRLRIYLAKPMTGRTGHDLLTEAFNAQNLAREWDVQVFDPVMYEDVPNTTEPVKASPKDLGAYWQRDKELIRASHVLIDQWGEAKSEGTAHEIGYARYHLWKPVIRVYPGLNVSVARLEDDVIASNLAFAFFEAVNRFGTPWKRLKWRAQLLNRCLLNYLKIRLLFLFDWV